MSAQINFHLEPDAEAPVVDSGYRAGRSCLTLYTNGKYRGADLSIYASNDQLAAIAKAILAHLERQEAGDFETEVA